MRLEKLLGKKTLIVGGLKSGKTRFLAEVLEEIELTNKEGHVTVIDMAPEKRGEIGGALRDYVDVSSVNYLRPKIVYAPRTMGKVKSEVLKYAEENRRSIKQLLERFERKPSKILIINDLTLYLHAGSLNDLMKVINLAETFIGTAYYGKEFNDRGSGINLREKILTEKLMKAVDEVICLKRGDQSETA